MLTLRTLAKATPRPILLRALMQCRVHVTRAVEDFDDFDNRVKECSGLVRATDGDRFATIMFYDPDQPNLALSKVWAHCSCPYFTFNVEVTNAAKKSSDVLNSNGELPKIRNPSMIPHFCKHLIALSKVAVAAKYKAVGRLGIEQREAKKAAQDKNRKAKQGKKLPPEKALRRPGERPAGNQVKKPAVKPLGGPKGPKGPKSVVGPKPMGTKPTGLRRPR